MDLFDKIQEAKKYIFGVSEIRPVVGLVLGSGLQFVEARVDTPIDIPYKDIPHFKTSSVPGHSGKLRIGVWQGTPVYMFCGRIHLYEGHTPEEVTFGIRVAAACGVKRVVLTNAAGGLSPTWGPGNIIMLKDHINLQATNVLCGTEDTRIGHRFIDMTDAYSSDLRTRVRRWARSSGFPLREGVYAGLLGPSYETKAEIRMLKTLGADTVGMSTVQETIAARQAGVEVLGFSIVTNLAAGVSAGPLSHDEVKETAKAAESRVLELLDGVVPILGQHQPNLL